MTTTKEIPEGSPIRCNRCSKKFSAPKMMHRNEFWGQSAARIADEFCTCPECGQTDVHWVYASDIMPKFDGTEFQIKKQAREWTMTN